jgi:hypothetical protein
MTGALQLHAKSLNVISPAREVLLDSRGGQLEPILSGPWIFPADDVANPRQGR